MPNTSRQRLIQKRGYSSDIQGDEVSLYISNYVDAAEYLAKRIGKKDKTVVELCCGIGVTLEQLARNFQRAIGVDLDPQILAWCKHNLTKAGVIDNVTLIQGDIGDSELLETIQADVAVYDIPFWDIGISKDVHSSHENPNLKATVEAIRKFITSDIVICVPAHYTYDMAVDDLGKCEYQEIYRPDHKRSYIYLGSLIQQPGITKLEL